MEKREAKNAINNNMMAKCKECKTTFVINSCTVHKDEYDTFDHQAVWVTYYECPECGKRHFVQIDNAYTNGRLIDLTKTLAKLTHKQRSGKKVTEKQKHDVEQIQQDLANKRSELIERYQETEMTSILDGFREKVVVTL